MSWQPGHNISAITLLDIDYTETIESSEVVLDLEAKSANGGSDYVFYNPLNDVGQYPETGPVCYEDSSTTVEKSGGSLASEKEPSSTQGDASPSGEIFEPMIGSGSVTIFYGPSLAIIGALAIML